MKNNQPKEYKVVALRECPTPEQMQLCDSPDKAVDYWRKQVVAASYFDPERECLVAIMLNTRRRVKGHYLISIGTTDCILVSPLIVFRVAVTAAAAALILAHSHPSGEPEPSAADIKITRDLVRAGQVLRIEVLDHVIVGCQGRYASLKEMGYL